MADKKGLSKAGKFKPGTKAGEIASWHKEEFELWHGHVMAIYALLKGIKNLAGM